MSAGQRKIRGSFRNYVGPQLQATRRMLLARQRGLCALCARPVSLNSQATIDHITPTSRGGLNIPDNWQLAHLGCNRARGNAPLPYRNWTDRIEQERRARVEATRAELFGVAPIEAPQGPQP